MEAVPEYRVLKPARHDVNILQKGGILPRSAYPNCLLCLHFKVSWDPALPRSCGLFGFKSLDLPSAEVFRSTGKHCPAFRERKGRP